MKIKTFLSNKKSRNKFIVISTVILLFFVLLLSTSFAQLTPISSVAISSEKLSYTKEDEGAWQITKSAKWISKGKARITLNVESQIMPNNEFTDVILVLDTSGSMLGETIDDDGNKVVKLSQLQSDVTNLINDLVPEGNNIALITFNDTSEIITDFTNDTNILQNSINNLVAVGNTNYYQALVNVDRLLKNYQFQNNRDCVVLFLTDGLPNIETPNEISQYQYLKTAYPSLTINSIQYEMGDDPVKVLKQISDNQYVAYTNTLSKFLYRAAVSPVPYDNFEITDYIESEYFTVEDKASITVTEGTVNLESNKVIWNLDEIGTGLDLEMTIDINLNKELIGIGGLYPTNKKLEVITTLGDTTENVTSALTPILADNYQIIYDANDPEGCTVTGLPEITKASVFDTVSLSTKKPSCEGYQFKGWEITSKNIEKINADYFIMPEENVTVRATWAKLSLIKTMDGKISAVQNLYQMMADNSVPDNIKSEYVSSSTGVDFVSPSSDTNGKGIYQAVKLEGENTPIYYYRGEVNNNNLRFANFCWKIVRTTSTKGIKLIYNGVPNADGSCTATGTATQIGTSAFNPRADSIAYNGYMYGDVYKVTEKRGDVVGLGGKTEIYQSSSSTSTTNYIYSSSVTYDETTGLYTLVDGKNRVWNDTYSVDSGNQFLYTCLSETLTTCSTVNFITRSENYNRIDYVSFTGGETADDILNKEIVYGNDVVYDETTGQYTLQTTMKSKIGDWKTDRTIIGGENGYHYTCLNESEKCEIVNYINYIGFINTRSYGHFYYAQFSNGIKVEDAVKQMTTESLHTTSSTIKTVIDNWYATNMTAYTDKLEDTAWCNDRTVSYYGSWDKNGSSARDFGAYFSLNYKTFSNRKSGPVLVCRNKNDAYTVDDIENGNGDLTYPVALLTFDEVVYAGSKYGLNNSTFYLNNEQSWWMLSPGFFYNFYAVGYYLYPNGDLNNLGNVTRSYGVRPSISLSPGTKSIDGDGTPENPFVVE